MTRLLSSVAAALLALVGCRSRSAPPGDEPPANHAVIVHFRYGLPDLSALRAVEGRVEQAILAARVGEYDGDEIATDLSDGSLYLYGPDAEKLLAAVLPVLESAAFMQGAVVTVRSGPPGAPARTITIGAER